MITEARVYDKNMFYIKNKRFFTKFTMLVSIVETFLYQTLDLNP